MSEPAPNEGLPESDDIWRQEVQARVSGYRTRKGRPIEGAFSMRFPFPPADAASPAGFDESLLVQGPSTLASIEEVVTQVVAAHPAPPEEIAQEPALGQAEIQPQASAPMEQEIVPQASPAPRSRARRKVIAFPKPLVAEPNYQGAEPVLPERPRIMEVPPELEAYATTPLLDGLFFPSQQSESKPAPADHVELPLQPATIAQRIYAALMDCAIVLAGALFFALVSFRLLPRLSLNKSALLIAAALPVLLWAVYHYLLLVYGGETIGMRMAGIRLRSFNGKQPGVRQRRNRAIGLCFAAASLMMGLLWVFVDVDTLGWHDRISRTYLVASH